MRYSQVEGREPLLETISDEKKQEGFIYGFMSAIAFAHYKNLSNDEKQFYCNEKLESVLDSVGLDFMNEFLKEFDLPPMQRLAK